MGLRNFVREHPSVEKQTNSFNANFTNFTHDDISTQKPIPQPIRAIQTGMPLSNTSINDFRRPSTSNPMVPAQSGPIYPNLTGINVQRQTGGIFTPHLQKAHTMTHLTNNQMPESWK